MCFSVVCPWIISPCHHPEPEPEGYRPETLAFTERIEYTRAVPEPELRNIDRLVRDLFGEYNPEYDTRNTWDRLILYPLLPGNGVVKMYNLIDPRNLDAAHRLLWIGSPIHNDKGVFFNGTTQAARTFFVPGDTRIGFGVYLNGGTLYGGVWPHIAGGRTQANPILQMKTLGIIPSEETIHFSERAETPLSLSPIKNTDFIQGGPTSDTSAVMLQNGEVMVTRPDMDPRPLNHEIYFGASGIEDVLFTNTFCSFQAATFYINKGAFTLDEYTALYAAIDRFNKFYNR